MTQLQKTLTVALLAATLGTLPAKAQSYPDPLAPPGQASAVIQQQNLSTQYNGIQLQQNMTVDRLREQQLFTPQPLYGAESTFRQPLGANNPTFEPQPPALPPRPQPKTALAEPAPTPVPVAEAPAPRPQQSTAPKSAPARVPSAQ
jgi:hypothetical protein